MEEFSICLVQTNLFWQDAKANRRHFESLIKQIQNADLIMMPEMFTTGFTMEPHLCWEEPEGETLRWMREMAIMANAAICGSLVIKEDGRYFNRLYFVQPDGNYHTYNKRHLFTLAGEEKVYTAGKSHLILEFRGFKIMPLVCYDLRFPVWCRNTHDIDLQLFCANWPHRRSEAWSSLLKARAIENMCFVAGVNRVGDDANGITHSGYSEVFDELGNSVLNFKEYSSEVKSVTLNKAQIIASRERFRFLADRDQFTLEQSV